jgi:2-polyprenyl-3-methyl-5-hydroxy-6-metoxy-1,4-benzoquinol methylase
MSDPESRLRHEIEHGRYLASHGAGEIWNWEGVAGRRRWSRRVALLTGHLSAGMKVLELGCGTGYFTQELAKTGAAITAIDISPDLLELARGNVPAPNVTFAVENAYATRFGDGWFDTVVGISVLHHLDIELGLAEIARVLKPAGTICFSEPNMLNPQIAIQKNVPAIKRWLGDSPDETAFIKWGLASRLRRHGFTGVRVEPFDFLHPSLPAPVVPIADPVCRFLERIPLLREIAGSLYVVAKTAP